MPAFAAFLRGMNLGGRRIANDELCAALSAIGLADVRAFRASGNVAFTSTREATEQELARHIEEGLAAALGYPVPTYLRSAEEVRAIAAHEPFALSRTSASAGKLQVLILLEQPSSRAGRAVLAMSSDEDMLALRGRELYWLPSGGVLDSRLDLTAIAALLGPTTQRTKGTIEQLAAKHFPA